MAQEDGKNRLIQAVTDLSQGLCPVRSRTGEALAIRDDVAFFQAVKAALVKATRRAKDRRRNWTIAITPDRLQGRRLGEVIDIFAAAGLKKPDISILSDEFLAEVRGMPQRIWPWSCCASC